MNSSMPLPLRLGGGGGGGGHRRNTEGSRGYYGSYAQEPPSSKEVIGGPERMPPKEPQSVADRLIVGVDFGTTYSGVAAVYSATPDDIEMIRNWPGGNGIACDKVPTEIAYGTPADAPPGSAPTTRWGFQCRPDAARLRCFKLFLDWQLKLPSYVDHLDMAEQLKRSRKNVIDAVSDYLTLLYRHTMDTLTRRYGESFMKSTRVDFVLTCPAVWSDAAKNNTLLAAERAGMGPKEDIKILTEPEAAAVYTLRAIQPNFLKAGDNFIVCDAGGGTVDLIAYKITSLQPLRVEESAVGTGGLCGSAFLNCAFEEHVKIRLGKARFEELKARRNRSWQLALREFENFVKRNFNEDEHQEVNIQLPGLPDDQEAGIEADFLRMSADQIKEIFEPVVKQVCDLVQGQVDGIRAQGGIVSAIILVGGFGQSEYLYRLLRQTFGSTAPPPYSEEPAAATEVAAAQEHGPIEVMQPVFAWTAVARGAVLRGLEGSMVFSRKARKHYGTTYEEVYDPKKHSIHEATFSPLHNVYMVRDRMRWHIIKGEALSPFSPVAFEYARNFPPGRSREVQDKLIACEADEPPAKLTAACENVCTMKTNLNAVPPSFFKRETSDSGIEYDHLEFTLEMAVDSAGLGFELKVGGVRYGRVEADFGTSGHGQR